MIPKYSIQEWSEQVPWNTDAMVEQDLIICRALVSIFSDEFLASQLAFRAALPSTNYTCNRNPGTVRTLTLCRLSLALSNL